jgi:hypothetical protein
MRFTRGELKRAMARYVRETREGTVEMLADWEADVLTADEFAGRMVDALVDHMVEERA